MWSETMKFSRLKSLDDFNVKFEVLKKPDFENLRCQTLAGVLQKKEKSLLLFNNIIKECFARVKLQKEITALCQQQDSVSHVLSELRKTLQSSRDDKENNDSRKELRKSVLSLYEKNLSLKIEPANDYVPVTDEEYAIHFVFNNLIEKNNQDACSFILITDGKKYKIFNCQPPVDEIRELLSRLNQTNDLCSFTVNIRKCFANMLVSKAVKS